MDRQHIGLDEWVLVLINSPLVFLNFTANTLYAWCLFFPSNNRKKLKQPLKMLLEFLVVCSLTYCVTVVLIYTMVKVQTSFTALVVSWIFLLFYVHHSMACSVWLNFYFYIQIVPSQQAFWIWVKRNIRFVIYTALLLDGMFFGFNGVLIVTKTLNKIPAEFTVHNDTWLDEDHIEELHLMSEGCFYIIKMHLWGCLVLMTVSSFSTVRYLHQHIKSVGKSGSGFSSQTIQRQIRAAVTGISQGVLYLLYTMYYFIDLYILKFSDNFVLSMWVTFTVTSLYMSGTTINLGIGQSLFRRRAADVCKAIEVVCGAKSDKKNVASSEVVNTVTIDVQMSL